MVSRETPSRRKSIRATIRTTLFGGRPDASYKRAMRLAVIADIHGNIHALDAVLADIATRRVDKIVDLGDCASGPLWPRETMARLTALDLPTVRGNHDRQLAELAPEEMGPSDRFAFDALTTKDVTRLGALPYRLEVAPGIVAFHATPASDESYLIEEIENGRLVQGSPADIAIRLGDIDARLALCGHSHIANVVQLPDGRFVLNPGSVGCPAYSDVDHVSESGSPHARFAIVEASPNRGLAFEMLLVPYDHHAAARRAEANGRPEWAHALRTGSMPRAERRGRQSTHLRPG
jgi:predicted phosphodiesterase